MAIKYDITLSTTEPNNDVGLIKIRQADEQTQTLVVQITENGVPKSYEGLQVFFCAKLGQSTGLGIIEQKLNASEMTNPKNGKLEYTMRVEDWQILGRQTGYFSFRKMQDNHEYTEQFTTRDFYFNITKNVFSDGVTEVKKDGSTYVWTIEDLIRLFNEYIASGKTDWEFFVDQNREIIESVDPGGKVLTELIDSRKSPEGEIYSSLSERLDSMQNDSSDKSYYITPEMFGAAGDGVNDDTESFQKAVDYADLNEIPLYTKRSIYKVSQINIPGEDFQLFGNYAQIKASNDSSVFYISGSVKNLLIDNIELLPAYEDKTGMGLLIDTGDNIVQNMSLQNVKANGFEVGLKIKLGDKENTSSGIVGTKISGCEFKFNKKYGILIEQKNQSGRAWCNQNNISNCDISDNGSGFYIQNVSVQNLQFESCVFERNGYCEIDFDEAFVFKAENVFNVNFANCYFENNIPYRIASESEIAAFSASTEISEAGNKVVGDEELWWDYHNQGIRPLTKLDAEYFGDIIVNSKAVPKVTIEKSILSLSVRNISLLVAGDATIDKSYYFNRAVTARYPNCAYQSTFHLKNATVNPSNLNNTDNRFSGGETAVKNILEVEGVLSNSSSLVGDFWQNKLYQPINIFRNTISGTNDIYVSTSGDDANVGVIEEYPVRTIARALQKAQIVAAPFVTIHLDGHFNIDEIYNVGTKKIVFKGNGTSNTSLNTPAKTDGFLYFEIEDTSLVFENLTINLRKPNVSNFIFNYFVLAKGKNSITFSKCALTSNDSFCSLVNNINDDCTVNFDNSTFGSVGAVYRGYPSNAEYRSLVRGATSWQYGKLIGTTAERPIARFLAQGYQYFDTSLGKPIWWNGSAWKDSAGNTV